MKEQPKSRENGFYRVKINDRWVVAELYDSKDWYLPGLENCFEDRDFEEIDERKISRLSGEPPKPDREWIDVRTQKPNTDALLMTSSRIIIIGDWYDGGWRTHRSEWLDGKLVSAFKENDIIAWQPLPETQIWRPLYEDEKLSGEAKTPDQPQDAEITSVIFQTLKHYVPDCWIVAAGITATLKEKFRIQELTGGSVPTPSDEPKCGTCGETLGCISCWEERQR